MRLELVGNDRVVKEYIKGFEVKCEKCGRVIKTVLYKNLQPILNRRHEDKGKTGGRFC